MKEETPKQFIQVFIKSEADLPEDAYTKEYIVHSRDGCVSFQCIYWKQDDLDWYLKPVEHVSDEDIEKAAYGFYSDVSSDQLVGFMDGARAHRDGKIK